jgi:mRNA interferase YafQ
MRTIELTGTFKRDYKREAKGRHREILESDFIVVVMALAHDQQLAEKYRDHARTQWRVE